MAKAYRPSNGTEGAIFMAAWCEKCARMDFSDEDSLCPIMGAALAFGIGDEEYPDAWQYSDDGTPICSEFQAEQSGHYRCTETPDMFAGANT